MKTPIDQLAPNELAVLTRAIATECVHNAIDNDDDGASDVLVIVSLIEYTCRSEFDDEFKADLAYLKSHISPEQRRADFMQSRHFQSLDIRPSQPQKSDQARNR